MKHLAKSLVKVINELDNIIKRIKKYFRLIECLYGLKKHLLNIILQIVIANTRYNSLSFY